ncbi:hypothetical protein [Thiomonas sp. X19]|uniref:hypothetical protein n=1 Tax=Thiomonas sp. X19 TaxID=1050370 RepID=UPI0011BF0110|nr:hypothetical protein [Thiomonas sp. X19]
MEVGQGERSGPVRLRPRHEERDSEQHKHQGRRGGKSRLMGQDVQELNVQNIDHEPAKADPTERDNGHERHQPCVHPLWHAQAQHGDTEHQHGRARIRGRAARVFVGPLHSGMQGDEIEANIPTREELNQGKQAEHDNRGPSCGHNLGA